MRAAEIGEVATRGSSSAVVGREADGSALGVSVEGAVKSAPLRGARWRRKGAARSVTRSQTFHGPPHAAAERFGLT